MEKYDFAIEKAFFLLNNGYILHVNGEDASGEIWKKDGFFLWKCSGQSANKATKKELQWILDTIFKSRSYLVFSNWCDVQLSFSCYDERSLWLFSDGKYTGYHAEVKV